MLVVEELNGYQAEGRRMLVNIVQCIDVMNLISMRTFRSSLNERLQAAQEAPESITLAYSAPQMKLQATDS